MDIVRLFQAVLCHFGLIQSKMRVILRSKRAFQFIFGRFRGFLKNHLVDFYKFEDDVEEFCSVLKNHVRQVLKGLGEMRGARMPYTNVRRQGDTLLSRLKSSKELQRVKIKQMKKSSVF